MSAHDMFRNICGESLDALLAQVMELVGMPGDEPLTDDELHAVMRRIGLPPAGGGAVRPARRAAAVFGASQLWSTRRHRRQKGTTTISAVLL